MISSIGQIAVVAKDVARATAFYKDVLGLKFLFSAGPALSFFDCGGVRLMISKAEGAEFDHPGSIIYYKVGDIDQAFMDLSVKGVVFEAKPHLVAPMPDHDLWMTFCHDSEGNPICLMCEKPKP